jgi:hypothetical protein
MALSDDLRALERDLKRLIEVVEGLRARAEGQEREAAGPGAPAPRPRRLQ